MCIRRLSRPLTIAMLVCLTGFGAGTGAARLTNGAATQDERTIGHTTVPTTNPAPTPQILDGADPLPRLAPAPKPKPTTTKVTPPPVAPPPPVTPPPVTPRRHVTPPPPPTEKATPLGG
jgi:hypothetical protein